MSSQYAATTSTSSTGVHKKEVVHEQRNKSQHSQLLVFYTVNLIGTAGVLYPPRLKSYSHVRKRALELISSNDE
ncbi:hypothetical protein Q3G72_023498 [Acer saccharum]|nr:hypothetical protein Q3G72_023498 [Acer saccharum]